MEYIFSSQLIYEMEDLVGAAIEQFLNWSTMV
jgi:hypothetical protein